MADSEPFICRQLLTDDTLCGQRYKSELTVMLSRCNGFSMIKPCKILIYQLCFIPHGLSFVRFLFIYTI